MLAGWPALAHAALGEVLPNTVELRDANLARTYGTSVAELKAFQKSVAPAYAIHETTQDGVWVREYVTVNDHKVFAVAWNGLAQPDLSVVLGLYTEEFRTAERTQIRARGRRSLVVHAGRVTVERSGHMRDLRGRAFDAALVPPGVGLDEIR